MGARELSETNPAVRHRRSSARYVKKRAGTNVPTRFCFLISAANSTLLKTVFLVECINTTTSLCCLLLSGVERMAFGASLDMDLLLCGSYGKCIAAVTGHCSLIILRMNSLFHCSHLFQCSIFSNSLTIISHQHGKCKMLFYTQKIRCLRII